jgi:LPS export ABC transporter protein LptC
MNKNNYYLIKEFLQKINFCFFIHKKHRLISSYLRKKIINTIIFFIIIIFTNYCKNNKSLKIEEIEKENGSTISIRNFERMSINDQGKLLWKLNAKETFYFNKTDISILYDMNVEQFENGKIKSKIKADKGIINKKENKINASGNIYVKTTEGKILEAEELEMDTETNTVTSDKRVIIKSDGTTIKGVGLIAENGLNKFKILKPEGISSSGSNPLKK